MNQQRTNNALRPLLQALSLYTLSSADLKSLYALKSPSVH